MNTTRQSLMSLCAIAGLLIASLPITAAAQPPGRAENAFVNVGLPGVAGSAGRVFLPDEVTIRAGGVVNFATVQDATGGSSGFHPIAVYKVANRTRLSDIKAQIAGGADQIYDRARTLVLDKTEGAGCCIDSDPSGLRVFFEVTPTSAPRIVGVYFPDRGTYLVICRVTSHFNSLMVAMVTVR